MSSISPWTESWTPRVVVLSEDRWTSTGQLAPPIVGGAKPTRIANVEEAQEVLERRATDLVVVTRSLPVSDRAPYERLTAIASDCEFVQYLGPWCEGEGRTGVAIDGYRRVFWHAWQFWWRGWLDRFRGESRSEKPLEGAILGIAADADASQALGVALAEMGARCVPFGVAPRANALVGGPDAVVWSGSQLGGREAEGLRSCCDFARERGAPVIALLDFPRPETVAAARAIGAAGVFGKPLDGDLLGDAIRDAIATQSRGPRQRAGGENRQPSELAAEVLRAA